MTTARDVIAREVLGAFLDGERCKDTVARRILEAILSAPESVRLELAAELNPWRPKEEMPTLEQLNSPLYSYSGGIETDEDGTWRHTLP